MHFDRNLFAMAWSQTVDGAGTGGYFIGRNRSDRLLSLRREDVKPPTDTRPKKDNQARNTHHDMGHHACKDQGDGEGNGEGPWRRRRYHDWLRAIRDHRVIVRSRRRW